MVSSWVPTAVAGWPFWSSVAVVGANDAPGGASVNVSDQRVARVELAVSRAIDAELDGIAML